MRYINILCSRIVALSICEKNIMKTTLILLFAALTAHAQLAVTVSPVKVTGQKAIVPLALKNNLTENIESARAAVFLLDDQGKMAGQSTKWVIGGTKDKPGLAAGATNVFHFVIPLAEGNSRQFGSTNLAAKIQFNRVVLEGGKLADVTKDVSVTPATK